MRYPHALRRAWPVLLSLGLVGCQSPRPHTDPAFAERMLNESVRSPGNMVVEIAGLDGSDEEVAIAVRFVAPSLEDLEYLCIGWFNWQYEPEEHFVVEGPQGPVELVPWPDPWRDFKGTVTFAKVPTPTGTTADGRAIAILICPFRTALPDEVVVTLRPDSYRRPQAHWDTTPRTFRVRDDAR